MPIRDLLKKKDKHSEQGSSSPSSPETPEFKIFRSDTNTTEEISPPNFAGDRNPVDGSADQRGNRLFKPRNRSISGASGASDTSASDRPSSRQHRRLSERLHLRKDVTSANVPIDLPAIIPSTGDGEKGAEELQWEKRATMLARKNEETISRPTTPARSTRPDLEGLRDLTLSEDSGRRERSVSSKKADDNIQEAIRLHEAGQLEVATKMFGRLADPNGENNALSQVLYGLALRYVCCTALRSIQAPLSLSMNRTEY